MAFVTPVVEHWLEREIAQLVYPMKDRSNDPSHHERTLLPRSYISLPASPNNDCICLVFKVLFQSWSSDINFYTMIVLYFYLNN